MALERCVSHLPVSRKNWVAGSLLISNKIKETREATVKWSLGSFRTILQPRDKKKKNQEKIDMCIISLSTQVDNANPSLLLPLFCIAQSPREGWDVLLPHATTFSFKLSESCAGESNDSIGYVSQKENRDHHSGQNKVLTA